MKKIYYDRQGKPMTDVTQWGKLFEDINYKIVKQEYTSNTNRYWISTTWIGIDHGFSTNGPPIIFETMIFDHSSNRPGADLDCKRYATEEEAMQGHKLMLEKWQAIEKVEAKNESTSSD